METKEKIKQQIVGGLVGLTLGLTACAPEASVASAKVHQNCYGLHIREGREATVEFYKAGWLVTSGPIRGTLQLTINGTKMTYTNNNGATTEYTLRREEITK